MKNLIIRIYLLFSAVLILTGCPNSVTNNSNSYTPPVDDWDHGYKHISIRCTKAFESIDAIAYESTSMYFHDDTKDKALGVLPGKYYGIQAMLKANYDDVSNISFISFRLEGNTSAGTYLATEKVKNYHYGEVYPLYIAEDETSENLKITAIYDLAEDVQGTLTFTICEKFNRDAFSENSTFANPTLLLDDDVFFIRDTIRNNSGIDYYLDFSNCWFEFNTVQQYAFTIQNSSQGLRNLKSMILPDSITTIYGGFEHCYNMKMDKLPANLEFLGGSAFAYCSSITIDRIPDGVTCIDYDTFKRCDGITSIVLPVNLKELNLSAFDYCKNLSVLKIPDSVENIYTSQSIIFFDIVVSPENREYRSENGTLYSKNGKTLYCVPTTKVGTYYTIPSSVTKIKEYALSGLQDLQILHIPSSVAEVEAHAISDCAYLKQIDIDFAEKPDGWSDEWLQYPMRVTVNFLGSGNGSGNNGGGTGGGGSDCFISNGTYTIKNNTSAQLEFSSGVLYFIYNGLRKNPPYSYEMSGNVLTVTWATAQGTFVGTFQVEKMPFGYKLLKKDDTAGTWIATWTHNDNFDEMEIYQ